jgi:hypothetical protein
VRDALRLSAFTEFITFNRVTMERGCLASGPPLAFLQFMLTDAIEHVTASSAAPGASHALLRRIQSEYVEMPGLILTEAQARRLWALDDRTCRVVLATLVERSFLKRTTTGAYVRASD